MADDGIPLYELKTSLVFYLASPPSLTLISDICQLYFNHYGDHITRYRSTAPGKMSNTWDIASRELFMRKELLELYSKNDWGYVFSDSKYTDSWLFMFHGSRPKSEPGKASFIRFDFPWNINVGLLRNLAHTLSTIIPFTTGFGGYYLQARTNLRYSKESWDYIFGITHRYWGIEAHNLDITVNHVLHGYKCVNWLTLLGLPLIARVPDAIVRAKIAATQITDSPYGTILECGTAPIFGDQNRLENISTYRAVAEALLPLQMKEHAAFGGTLWTDENTIKYIRRFTSTSAR